MSPYIRVEEVSHRSSGFRQPPPPPSPSPHLSSVVCSFWPAACPGQCNASRRSSPWLLLPFLLALQLANIYSTEFVVETADSRAGKQYRQVFRNNMQEKVRMILDVVVVMQCFRSVGRARLAG